MKSYHLTQEQVRDIGEKLHIKGELTTTNLVNAVLDKVLGEPVGQVRVMNGETFIRWYKHKEREVGTKLYAPKEKS